MKHRKKSRRTPPENPKNLKGNNETPQENHKHATRELNKTERRQWNTSRKQQDIMKHLKRTIRNNETPQENNETR